MPAAVRRATPVLLVAVCGAFACRPTTNVPPGAATARDDPAPSDARGSPEAPAAPPATPQASAASLPAARCDAPGTDTQEQARQSVLALREEVARERTALAMQRWGESEDGTSIFHYVRLARGAETRFVRVAWNGGAQQPPTVTDLYFSKGKLVAGWERALPRSQFEAVTRGAEPAQASTVVLWRFEASKLVSWYAARAAGEALVSVSAPCARWQEETERLLQFAALVPPPG